MRLSVVTTLIAVLLASCYLPAPEHGLVSGRAMVTRTQLGSIQPGTHTREDILLQFGDPSRILAEDNVFVYDWERVTGWFAIVIVPDEPVSQRQHFVVAFDEKSTVLHAELIDLLVWQSSEEELESLLEEWRSASGESQ